VRVHADGEKTEQILLNLLANAVKYTQPGGHIQVVVEETDARVHIHVRDTGQGIPAERLSSIFDPFVQVQSGISRDSGGVGLGLAISRDLARAMNGDIEVHSELGAGSRFTVHLPAAR
jgi:signal transduction histidine kinase